MKLIKTAFGILTTIIILVIYKYSKKRIAMQSNSNEDTQPIIVKDAVDRMSPLTTEISASIDNLTELINKHRDTVSDIYLKTLGIPNIVFTLIITNEYFRQNIINSHLLTFLFMSAIISYCSLILFTVSSLYVTNIFYNRHKTKLCNISDDLNTDIEKQQVPAIEKQEKAKQILIDLPVKSLVKIFRAIVAISGIVNIISLIAFIITISITVINEGNSMTKCTSHSQQEKLTGTIPSQKNTPTHPTIPGNIPRKEDKQPLNESNDPRRTSKPIPIVDTNIPTKSS